MVGAGVRRKTGFGLWPQGHAREKVVLANEQRGILRGKVLLVGHGFDGHAPMGVLGKPEERAACSIMHTQKAPIQTERAGQDSPFREARRTVHVIFREHVDDIQGQGLLHAKGLAGVVMRLASRGQAGPGSASLLRDRLERELRRVQAAEVQIDLCFALRG